MELANGLYCYVWTRHGNGCNTYAVRYNVDGQPRYLVVDPGQRQILSPILGSVRGGLTSFRAEPVLDLLLGEMAKDGIKPESIGMVACTHCHPDHCEAALEIKRQSGAPIAIHEDEREAFIRVANESYDGKSEGPPKVEPDIYLDEGELLLGRPDPVSLRIIHSPGHSPGSIAIYSADKRALIAGDSVFYKNVGRTDTPGGNARLLKSSVTKLSELDVEYLLTGHPYGHSGVISGKGEVESNFRFILLNILRF